MEEHIKKISESLSVFSEDPQQIEELSNYCTNGFQLPKLGKPTPLPDEDQHRFWEGLLEQNPARPALESLEDAFPQLHFPIQEGISQSKDYASALRKGTKPSLLPAAQGLQLKEGENIRLFLHPSLGGYIPVLDVGNEHDFVSIIQALAHKNEPKPIPHSMGAILISGLTNWARIGEIKEDWQVSKRGLPWPLYFGKEILPQKSLYQDKLIVLSRKPYSGVSHQQIGLAASEWMSHSFNIRLHHESAHYYTKRYLGGMRIHLHDEILADYAGIVESLGHFSLDWFQAFLGIEGEGYRSGARMENYLPPSMLSPELKAIMAKMLQAVGRNLLRFHEHLVQDGKSTDMELQLLSIASLNLSELAGNKGFRLLNEAHAQLAVQSASSDRDWQNHKVF